ncbi:MULTISPECIES: hypothetical protein [Enterocloster]|uniref:Flp pilus-assembly TadE/G-like n=1 Tax=Enterocloster lavalensis TaxID=460384 RepID=A0A1I0AQH3_9FIRM|nr:MULTISPECIES: hypothetical protein [Enterocloster]MDR3758286.1 hypothetical protein [Enterocloster sp.]PST33442.1 hypothetical protein C7256_10845 [Enterocloster lavalensis]SES96574.1 hypothetical protein SAMN05216313_101155 [Enterocloster lavalensis]
MAGNSGIRKIQSTKGASLAIGLVYFLICATVGSVVLAAAMANISHVKSEKINEGSYLAVMSAGTALKEQLEGAARECSVDHGQQDDPAGESQRAAFKAELLAEAGSEAAGTGTEAALAAALYRVYLNCVEEDNRLYVPQDEEERREKGESLTFTFRLEAGDEGEPTMGPVRADITLTPDYVVMDSGDSQQLQVRIESVFSLEPDEGTQGQYYLRMTANGVVYYVLEETVTEVEGGDGDSEDEEDGEGGDSDSGPEYSYEYASRAVISSDRPVFSGRPPYDGSGVGGGGS